MKKGLLTLLLLGSLGIGMPGHAEDSIRQETATGQPPSVFMNHSGSTVETTDRLIRLVVDHEEIIVRLDDNPASRDFLSLLPLDLTFEDYNGTEKISYLPRKLNIQGAPSHCKPSAGSFTYYAPWGNLAIFYHDFRQSEGLVPLGHISSGWEKLAGMQQNFSIRIEKMEH